MFLPAPSPSRFAERAASLAYLCNLGELADSARWLTFAPDAHKHTRYAVHYRQHGTKTYLLIPRDRTPLFTAFETDGLIRQGGRTYRVRYTPIGAGEHARAARLFRRHDVDWDDCHIIRLDRVERVPNAWLRLPALPLLIHLPRLTGRVLRVRQVLPIASAVLAVGAVVGVGLFTSVNLRK